MDNCFDLKWKIIAAKRGVHARDEVAAAVPRKAYTSSAHWKE